MNIVLSVAIMLYSLRAREESALPFKVSAVVLAIELDSTEADLKPIIWRFYHMLALENSEGEEFKKEPP